MKVKYIGLILSSMLLISCSSSVTRQEIIEKMPNTTEQRISMNFNAPSVSPSTDMIYIAKLKLSGSEQADKLMSLLAQDNINLGISGKNSSVSKALVIYSLENATKIGKNIEMYMIGSAEDKVEIEKLTNARNIKLHYFIK